MWGNVGRGVTETAASQGVCCVVAGHGGPDGARDFLYRWHSGALLAGVTNVVGMSEFGLT